MAVPRYCEKSRRSTGLSILVIFSICVLLLRLHSSKPEESLRTLPEERGLACPSARPLYVFLHLHKTGGNSLKQGLFRFTKKNRLRLHHTCHRARRDDPLKAWWFARNKDLNGYDCNLEDLTRMPPKLRNNVDFVVGHQYFGVHRLFPRRDARYFTMVRKPLIRKLSHFNHFERNRSALHSYLIEHNRNYMTKHLSSNDIAGEVTTDLRARFIDIEAFAARAALRAAKRNLATRFFFVGLHERYGESMCILSHILNVSCGRQRRLSTNLLLDTAELNAQKENVRGGSVKLLQKLSRSVKQAALRAEDADVQLYRFARRLFEEKLAMYPQCRNVKSR